MTKFLAFDIEIATTIPEGVDDWSTLHPMGISCAATWASDEDKPRVWVGQQSVHGITHRMSDASLKGFIQHLVDFTNRGYKIVTVNGAGFDFRELASHFASDPELYAICQSLALDHIDIFFDVFCRLGYSPGLDAMARGMGLDGKTEGMDGAKAPELWQRGEYGKVIDYIIQDVRMTLALAESVDEAKELRWVARSGRENTAVIPKLLSVKESLELPLPDTSWMNDPWTREKFTAWMIPDAGSQSGRSTTP